MWVSEGPLDASGPTDTASGPPDVAGGPPDAASGLFKNPNGCPMDNHA